MKHRSDAARADRLTSAFNRMIIINLPKWDKWDKVQFVVFIYIFGIRTYVKKTMHKTQANNCIIAVACGFACTYDRT